MQAHSSQRGPMQAHEGPHQPTTANDGQRRSTKAHSSQRGPTQAHEDKKGPKRRQTRRLGPRCVFFILFFAVLLTTTAPNDADTSFGPFRRFGFHLGLVFFFLFSSRDASQASVFYLFFF